MLRAVTAGDAVGEGVAVDVPGDDLAVDRGVFVGADVGRAAHRCVVDRVDLDGHHRVGVGAFVVVDADGEGIVAVVVLVRRVGVLAGDGVEQQRAVVDAALDGVGQLVAIHVTGDDLAVDALVLIGFLGLVSGDRGIVDRIDGDVDHAGGGAAVAIADGDGEGVAAVEVLARLVGVGAVGVEGDGAVLRAVAGGDAVGEGVAVDVPGDDLAVDRGVFVGADVGRAAHRCVVDRVDLDGHHRVGVGAFVVVDADGEGVVAVVVLVRRVGVLAGDGVEQQRAVVDAALDGVGQLVAFHVAGDDLAVDALVLVGLLGLVGGDRRIVDRGHIDADEAGGGAAFAIADGDGESIGPVVVLVRAVGVAAVAVEGEGAVLRAVTAGDAVGEGVAVDVAGIHLAVHRGVFGGAQVGRVGGRCVVDRVDGDPHHGVDHAALAVIDGDGERVRAVVVGIGLVGVLAGRVVEHQGAVAGSGLQGIGQAVAIGVGGVQLTGEGVVLIHADVGVVDHRQVIDRGDRQVDGAAHGAGAVVDAVGEAAHGVAGLVVGGGVVLQPLELGAGEGLAIADQGAIGEGDLADHRQAGDGDGECVAVHIGGRCDVQRGADAFLVDGEGVAVHYRQVVDRSDAHLDGGGIGAALAVADGVGEGTGAVEVGGRGEDDLAVDQGHGAVDRVLHADDGQAVAVHVRIVAQQGGGLDGQRGVFSGHQAVEAVAQAVAAEHGVAAAFGTHFHLEQGLAALVPIDDLDLVGAAGGHVEGGELAGGRALVAVVLGHHLAVDDDAEAVVGGDAELVVASGQVDRAAQLDDGVGAVGRRGAQARGVAAEKLLQVAVAAQVAVGAVAVVQRGGGEGGVGSVLGDEVLDHRQVAQVRAVGAFAVGVVAALQAAEGRGVVAGIGGIVHLGDVDGHAAVNGGGAVVDAVGEAAHRVAGLVVGGGVVFQALELGAGEGLAIADQGAVSEGDLADHRQAGDLDGEYVAVGVGGRLEAQRGADAFFGHGEGLAVHYRQVIHRGDADGDAAVHGGGAVVDAVGEAAHRVAGLVVGGGVVLQALELGAGEGLAIADQGAVGEGDLADHRQAGDGDGEYVAVGVGGRLEAQRGADAFFGHGEGLAVHHRQVVHRSDANGHAADHGGRAVIDAVGEVAHRVAGLVVGGGVVLQALQLSAGEGLAVADGAAVGQGHAADHGQAGDGDGERVAVHIGGCLEAQRGADAFLGHGNGVAVHHRGVVAAFDGDAGTGLDQATLAVTDLVFVVQDQVLALGQVVVGGRVHLEAVAGGVEGHTGGVAGADLLEVDDAEHVLGVDVAGVLQQVDAVGRGVFVGHRGDGTADHRGVVAAGDGDGDVTAGAGVAAIGDGHAVDQGQGLAGSQVVQGAGRHAVGPVHGALAVAGGGVAEGGGEVAQGGYGLAIAVGGADQLGADAVGVVEVGVFEADVAGGAEVAGVLARHAVGTLGDAAALYGGFQHRGVVAAFDGQGGGGGGDATVAVDHVVAVGEHQLLAGGQVVVGVGVDLQGTARDGHAGGVAAADQLDVGHREHVAAVHVTGVLQQVDLLGAGVFVRGGGDGRADHGGVVDAVDHHGGLGGDQAAMAVTDLVLVGEGDLLALGQVVVGTGVEHQGVAADGNAGGIVAAGFAQVDDVEHVLGIGVAGLGQQVDDLAGGVFVGADADGAGDHRSVVDAGDGQGQHAVAAELAVSGGERNLDDQLLAVGQGLVGRVARVQGPGAVGVEAEAGRGVALEAEGQFVAVDVGGGELAAHGGAVFGGAGAGGAGHGRIVDRGHVDRGGGAGGGGAIVVHGLVLEGGGAVPVAVRYEIDRAGDVVAGFQRGAASGRGVELAMLGQAGDDEAGDAAVDVAAGQVDLDACGLVFTAADGHGAGHRGVVGAGDGDFQVGGVAGTEFVGDGDWHLDHPLLAGLEAVVGAVAAVETPTAVAVEGQAVDGGGGGEGQLGAGVDVGGDHLAGDDAIAFIGCGGGGVDLRRIVGAGDGDGQGALRIQAAVADAVGDGQGQDLPLGQTLVAGGAGVECPGAVGVELEAVRGGAVEGVGQLVAVDIAAVELAADGGGVFFGGGAGGAGHGGIVHRVDGQADAVVVAELAIAGAHVEGVRAVVVGGRDVLQALQGGVDGLGAAGEHQGAGAVAAEGHAVAEAAQGQGAVADAEGGGEGVAVHVGDADGVAVGGAEGLAAVFVEGLGARDAVDRGVVDRVDHQLQRAGGAQGAVAEGVGDGWHHAAVVGVGGEGEFAVGQQGELAHRQVGGVAGLVVLPGDAEAGDAQFGAVDVAVVGQHVAGGDAVLIQGDGVVHGHRGIVGAVDGDGDAGLGAVGTGDFEGVHQLLADVQLVVGSIGDIAPVAGGVDVEGAVGAGGAALGNEGGWAVDIGDGQGATCGEGAVGLVQLHVGAAEHGGVVGAVDGDGDAGLGAVGAGDLEGVHQFLADVQLVVGGIGDVAPVAGRVDAEGAVVAGGAGLGDESGRAVDVGDAEGAAGGEGAVGFVQLHVGTAEHGSVVHAGDGDGQGAGALGAELVGHFIGHGEGQLLAFGEGLVGDVASVQGPGAGLRVEAEAGGGLVGEAVAEHRTLVGVAGLQGAADGLVFGDVGAAGGGDRCVVGTVEIDGDDAGVAGAGGVAHGDDEAVAGLLAVLQAVHGLGIHDIGIGAVGIDGQLAVGAFAAAAPGQLGVVHVGGGQLALDVGEGVQAGSVVDVGGVGAAGHRGVVDRGDAQVDGQRGGGAAAIGGGHDEAVGAVVVLGRGVGPGAVGVEHQGAVRRALGDAEGDQVAVGVAGGEGAADRGVFRRAQAEGGDEAAIGTRELRGDVGQPALGFVGAGGSIGQTLGGKTDLRLDDTAGGVQQDEAAATAGFTTTGGAACAGGAGCGGFEGLGRVDASGDGLLQLFGAGCGLGGAVIGDLRGEVIAGPASVAAQVDQAAVGQLDGDHAGRTGDDLVTLEDPIPLEELTLHTLGGECNDLADDAFHYGYDSAHGGESPGLASACGAESFQRWIGAAFLQ